jgi:predicted short-subunit dehydrogenase-like oxidoreductase (DUF2520 family)
MNDSTVDTIRTLVVLGSGNVAVHLARSFVQKGIEIVQVYSPTIDHARQLADEIACRYTNRLADLHDADLYLFALTDSAIPEVLRQRSWEGKLCVHTAGSVPLDVFKPFTQFYGVLYPFQTFSRNVPLALDEVPFFIEASDKNVEQQLFQLASKISSRIQLANSQQRQSLHLAGVFACNFVNHMLAIAENILKQNNLPPESIHPLISETVRKALIVSAEKAQTGPAIRNNTEIIRKHIEMLRDKPEWQKIYTFVSDSIYKMYHS